MNRSEELLLREYIRNNLRENELLNEGVKDVLISTLSTGLKQIKKLLEMLKKLTPASDKVISTLEKNDAGDFVSKVYSMGQEFEDAVESASKSVPSKKSESAVRLRVPGRTLCKQSTSVTINEEIQRRQALNEVVLGGFEVIGLILAAIGGVPLLLKGLFKLTGFLGLNKVSEKLEIAYEKAHHFEEAVIDIAIPDKALYAVYIAIQESKNPDQVANLKIYQSGTEESGGKKIKLAGLVKRISGRSTKRAMTFEEFINSEDKKNYQKRAWALVLLPWLVSGLFSLHHMLGGILGALEGAATGVKAIEVGTAAAKPVQAIAAEIGSAVSALVKSV